MFLMSGGHPALDFDLDLLHEIVGIIDARLGVLEDEAKECPDPDSWGIYDRAESLCGLGFAACQQYVTATSGWVRVERPAALALGPVHESGSTIVALVNHAANYWKHSEEWALGKSEKQKAKTQDGLERIFADVGDARLDYPLTVILAKVVEPPEWRFRHLIPLLVAWRDELARSAHLATETPPAEGSRPPSPASTIGAASKASRP